MPDRKTDRPIPHLPGFDSTAAFLREGYDFVGSRCRRLGSDAFHTRLMLRPVTCVRGLEAARMFYAPGRMTRRGAMPASVVALLQDRGSVQTLDGKAHRTRRALFLDLMSPERLEQGRRIFADEWQAAAAGWRGRTVMLRDEVQKVMTRTALRWCGVPFTEDEVAARTDELTAMIGAAGSLGPAYLRARALRARSERWARAVVHRARDEGRAEGALARIVAHRDVDGSTLNDAVAGVELLNLLRPIVAVGRYIVFAAHALHRHRDATTAFLNDAPGDAARIEAIAQEVRRLYPFFPVIGGRVLTPFTWRGRDFAAGEWLILDLYGTGRDGAAWDRAENFDPARHLTGGDAGGALIAQGGGDMESGHRCPGEWLTVALMCAGIEALLALDHDVPEQDLDIPRNRFPPWPRDGMRIRVASGPSLLWS